MNSVDKIRFSLFYGEAPEAACYGYMERNRGKFDDEDRGRLGLPRLRQSEGIPPDPR